MKLAKGIDPITGSEAPENDVINNLRVSRCLFYVADVLGRVIENGGVQIEREAPVQVLTKSAPASARHSTAASLSSSWRNPVSMMPFTVNPAGPSNEELRDAFYAV